MIVHFQQDTKTIRLSDVKGFSQVVVGHCWLLGSNAEQVKRYKQHYILFSLSVKVPNAIELCF